MFPNVFREIHRWGAHAMVITVWLHMYRVFLTESYKRPREFNWVVGVILLFLGLPVFLARTWMKQCYQRIGRARFLLLTTLLLLMALLPIKMTGHIRPAAAKGCKRPYRPLCCQ